MPGLRAATATSNPCADAGAPRPVPSAAVVTAPDTRARVLVVAADPLVAALVGMLLEPASWEPAFPLPGERPEDALARLRPPVVLLLDGEHAAARSDLFLARVQRARAGLVLFTPPPHVPGTGIAESAARVRGVPCVAMPVDRGALTRAIEAALARVGGLGTVGD